MVWRNPALLRGDDELAPAPRPDEIHFRFLNANLMALAQDRIIYKPAAIRIAARARSRRQVCFDW
jgi:hypothetical protein